MFTRLLTPALALLLCSVLSSQAAPPATAVAPEELHAPGGGRVWVYLPKNTPAGTKLPCVLIAPAGSRMFHGMLLGDGDKPEHLPWVAAGFAVVSYDISGPYPEEPAGDDQIIQAVTAFMQAKFGVSDGLAALDTALAKYPQIDPSRLYVVGHSSAATLSLQLAASSDRFKACVSFAPVLDVAMHLKPVLPTLDRAVPGFAEAVRAASPVSRVDAIRCPVFLFRAEDDRGTPAATTETYRDALRAHGTTVEYVTVPTGGHYDSMIKQGQPKAIAWIKALDQKPPKQ